MRCEERSPPINLPKHLMAMWQTSHSFSITHHPQPWGDRWEEGGPPILKRLLKGIPKGRGCFCADSAYPSRKNCRMVREKGRTPYIKPKKNTKVKKGCQPWRDMITLYLENRASFMKKYYSRNDVESIYSVLKMCFGNHLSSRRRCMQRRELYLKVIVYNIGRVNLYQEEIKA